MRDAGCAAESTSPSANTRRTPLRPVMLIAGEAGSWVPPLAESDDCSAAIGEGTLSTGVGAACNRWAGLRRLIVRTGTAGDGTNPEAAISFEAFSRSTISFTATGRVGAAPAGARNRSHPSSRPCRTRERASANQRVRQTDPAPSDSRRKGKATAWASGSEVSREAHTDVPVVAGRKVPVQNARRRFSRKPRGVVKLGARIVLVGQVLNTKTQLEMAPPVA